MEELEYRAIELTDDGLWCLFVGIVIIQLDAMGFNGDAAYLAKSLDMSFDEIKPQNIELWDGLIAADLAEFKAENPHEFG